MYGGYGGVEYVCDPPEMYYDPPYIVEQQMCNPVMPGPIIEPVYEPCYDVGYADPGCIDPYAMDPYSMDPYGMDPYAGYMDPYAYYDALQGMGMYGPWPKPYYDRPQEEDSDSDDDDCCRRRRRRRCCNGNGGGNITKGDINALMERFQQSLTIDWKRANIKEMQEENNLLKDLAREKKAMKKAVAKNKRDLLMREVLAGAGGTPAGPRPGQVVKIDYGY